MLERRNVDKWRQKLNEAKLGDREDGFEFAERIIKLGKKVYGETEQLLSMAKLITSVLVERKEMKTEKLVWYLQGVGGKVKIDEDKQFLVNPEGKPNEIILGVNTLGENPEASKVMEVLQKVAGDWVKKGDFTDEELGLKLRDEKLESDVSEKERLENELVENESPEEILPDEPGRTLEQLFEERKAYLYRVYDEEEIAGEVDLRKKVD